MFWSCIYCTISRLIVLVCCSRTNQHHNQCPDVISACQSNQSGIVTCYPLAAGTGSQLIDVGTTWLGGVIWGYPGPTADPTNGTNAKPQADLAEITINGFNNTNSYDLSNVVWHI